MKRWSRWWAPALSIGITAACSNTPNSDAPPGPHGDEALQGTVVAHELADIVVHLVDTTSNQRVETTRRIYRLFPDRESLFATAGDREPLVLRLENGRPHRLRAEAQGFEASAEIPIELPAGEKSREITVPVTPYAEPNATVALTVEAVDGVRIELRGVGDPTGYTYGKTERAGNRVQIDVPADRYWCRISAPERTPDWPTQLIELDLGGGEAAARTVVAGPGGTVRVLLPRGHRQQHVRFSVRPVPDKRTYAFWERRGVPADWRGEFRVAGESLRIATLAPGSYTIGVSANTGRRRWERDVTVVAGETVEIDFTAELRGFLEQLQRELDTPASAPGFRGGAGVR